MFVITNRQVLKTKTGLDQFGSKPNTKGPNELRLARIEREGDGYSVEFLDDRLTKAQARKIIRDHALPFDPNAQHWASLKVAAEVATRARANKSHVLFFVHGFNNNMKDVIDRAFYLQDNYGVEVIPFSWPANGGGVAGTVSYKSDKRDARASTGALERTMQFIHKYLVAVTEGQRRQLFEQAEEKHPENPEKRDLLYAKLLENECPFTVNALFHSMGNYLLKQMLKSTIAEGIALTFDNVLLVAADTNNLDHRLWVDRIRFRKRLFVTINEDDYALNASRAKSGSDQLARLGHFLRHLDAANAHYINFTNASWVKNSHSYFGEPAEKNDNVKQFFADALAGKAAEESLRFRPEGNWFAVE